MSVTTRKEIVLPFVGFYGSELNDILDDLEASDIDEENPEPVEHNWKAIYAQVAKHYAEYYGQLFKEDTGIDLNISFKRLWSPREYNFDTDRVYVEVDATALKSVVEKIGVTKVREALRDFYKPCDGFMPFTSTLESIEKNIEDFPDLFYSDVILELLFKSEIIYNHDHFLTDVRETYYQA